MNPAPASPATAPFSVARLPRIEFGAGSATKLPDLAARYGERLLVVTGARSFIESPHGERLFAQLKMRGCSWEIMKVSGEPSPQLVDDAVARYKTGQIEVVLGIGGGSVLDAAKAVAGLLRPGNSVMDHLEGVGPEKPYRGPVTPFIAVPTTAGTGSEATRNAVLSVHGEHGFKKSFRDEALVAQWAVVDPDLLTNCPPELIAANGMDALTQLLEALVSTRANPLTDALALGGLGAVRDGLLAWHAGGAGGAAARSGMAYAALVSGIVLAQAGLGAVHGLASPLGAFFPIPHGVACGSLAAGATRTNIDALQSREPENPALAKYAQAGRQLFGDNRMDDFRARQSLVRTLDEWSGRLGLPRLSVYGMCEADIPRVVASCRGSSMKTNPVVPSDEEIGRLLQARL